jgi:hypothetical protein
VEGELKVSRTGGGGLPCNPRARRSKPKMAALFFWRPFQDSCRVAMVEPPVSNLEPHGPPPLPARKGVSIGTAGCACQCSPQAVQQARPGLAWGPGVARPNTNVV